MPTDREEANRLPTRPDRPVFFLSDSTGISAETMERPSHPVPGPHFERRLIPFISSVEEARRVVAILDEAHEGGRSRRSPSPPPRWTRSA